MKPSEPMRLGGPLRPVPNTPAPALTYEDGSAEFDQHWRAAKKAHADLLVALGLLNYPFFVHTGPVRRARIDVALSNAEQIQAAAQTLAHHLAEARSIYGRVHDEPVTGGA